LDSTKKVKRRKDLLFLEKGRRRIAVEEKNGLPVFQGRRGRGYLSSFPKGSRGRRRGRRRKPLGGEGEGNGEKGVTLFLRNEERRITVLCGKRSPCSRREWKLFVRRPETVAKKGKGKKQLALRGVKEKKEETLPSAPKRGTSDTYLREQEEPFSPRLKKRNFLRILGVRALLPGRAGREVQGGGGERKSFYRPWERTEERSYERGREKLTTGGPFFVFGEGKE